MRGFRSGIMACVLTSGGFSCRGWLVLFQDGVAGGWAAGAAFGASWAGAGGFRAAGWGADRGVDVPKPAADPGGGQVVAGGWRAFPGAAQVGGETRGGPGGGFGGGGGGGGVSGGGGGRGARGRARCSWV